MINIINKIFHRFWCPECGERMTPTGLSDEIFSCNDSHIFYRTTRFCIACWDCENTKNCKDVGFW